MKTEEEIISPNESLAKKRFRITFLSDIYLLLPVCYKKKLPLLFFMILIGTFLEAFGIGAILPTIALLSKNNFIKVTNEIDFVKQFDHLTIIFFILTLLVFAYAIKTIYMAWFTWFQNSFVHKLQADLSKAIYTHYLNAPYIFHLNNNTSELIAHITGEVSIYTMSAVLPLIQAITELTILIGILGLLLYLQPLSCLAIIIFTLGFSYIYYKLVYKKLFQLGEARMLNESEKLKKIYQGLSGIREVKLHGVKDSYINSFSRHNQSISHGSIWMLTINMMPRLLLEFLAVIGIVILVFSMLYFQKQEPETIIPVIAIFTAAAFRIMPSFNKLIVAFQSLSYSKSSVNLLKNLNVSKFEENDVTLIDKSFSFSTSIKLVDVAFKYPTRQNFVFERINITLLKGQSIGIYGPSGVGKSTLLDLILGFLEPNQGQILVDGRDMWKEGLVDSWYREIGYVPQTIYLVDDSILSNIAFGIEFASIDVNKAIECLKKVELYELVLALPNGINENIGERGVQLSGGQRQRLGIARALYRNPSFLILDEATSALDMATEASIMNTIEKMHGDLTILIVAHRLSTLRFCDYRVEISSQGLSIKEGGYGEL